jgi:uncharacterized protein YbbC (DUF1343 family)
MIMTARLKAMPVTEMRMIGPDNDFLFSFWKDSRLAMNNPVFKPQGCLAFKVINYCITFTGMSVAGTELPMSRYHKLIFISVLLGIQLFQACVAESGEPTGIPETGAEQTSLYFPMLKGKAVGLVANHTSLIGKRHLADTLIESGITLTRIYSPEHGFRGDADAGAETQNAIDTKTCVRVISLYGNRYKPLPADLKGIDIMIYDIQDVGVRFYTYISTLHYVMEACAENHIPLLILDRPDPLGHYMDGPVLEPEYKSFVGLHPIPVVYGMTPGELAGMINGEGWLAGHVHCDLKVIPCRDYNHETFYQLPVNPSPNLNNMEAIYLYPSICFFEGTIMSLGRGTTSPFRVIGHPDYPDKSFSFVPRAGTSNSNPLFRDQSCYGIDLQSFQIDTLMHIRAIQLQWLIEAFQRMNLGKGFFTGYIDLLAGTGELREQILSGDTEQEIRHSWQPGLQEFAGKRKKYLLYPDFDR